jgi:hypothetical protein
MNNELSFAVEGVYRAFSAVPKPSVIEGCPCCIEDKEVAVLLGKPLREISPAEMSSYASSVFLTVGSVADFRFYLPRILEIAVTESAWWPDPEVIGASLASACWLDWAEEEKQGVTQLFDLIFSLLIENASGSELDSWLCAFSRSGLVLEPFLGKLSARSGAVLELYEWNAGKLLYGRLTSGFWDDAPSGVRELMEWFRSPSISSVVYESYGVDLSGIP